MGFWNNNTEPVKYYNKYKIVAVGVGKEGKPAFFESIVIANSLCDAVAYAEANSLRELVKAEYIGKND